MPRQPLGEFGSFPTTHWSLVSRAGHDGEEDQRVALGNLLLRYLPALRAHLVFGRRMAPPDADDLLQEFVAAKILERQLLGQADRQLGRFRSFLLKALDHFLIDELRRQGAKKRSPGDQGVAALGDHEDLLAADGQPSDAFEVAWARSVLDQALDRMQEHCRQFHREDCWGVFECRILGPILHGTPPVEYDELLQRFGFQSPSQASNVLTTAKRMFVRALRCVVGDYARDEEEIEEEIVRLRKTLAMGLPAEG